MTERIEMTREQQRQNTRDWALVQIGVACIVIVVVLMLT